MKERLKNNKGFTLVEIIVVLVILAILAAIAVPAVLGYVDESKKTRYIEEAHSIYTVIQTEEARYKALGNELNDDTYNNTEYKKELTAQSVAQALVNQISQSTSSETFEGQDQTIAENTRKLIPANDGDVKRIEGSDIKISNKKIGTVNYVTITRNQNNQLTIVVKATYSKQTSTVKAIMKKETDGNQWNIYRYEGASS